MVATNSQLGFGLGTIFVSLLGFGSSSSVVTMNSQLGLRLENIFMSQKYLHVPAGFWDLGGIFGILNKENLYIPTQN